MKVKIRYQTQPLGVAVLLARTGWTPRRRTPIADDIIRFFAGRD